MAEQATIPLRVRAGRVLHRPTAAVKAPLADPARDPEPDRETWTPTTWDSAQKPTHPAAGMDPQNADRRMPDCQLNSPAKDHPEDSWKDDHLVDP